MSITRLVVIAWVTSWYVSLFVALAHKHAMEKLVGHQLYNPKESVEGVFWSCVCLLAFSPLFVMASCTPGGNRFIKQNVVRNYAAYAQNKITSQEETALLKWADE